MNQNQSQAFNYISELDQCYYSGQGLTSNNPKEFLKQKLISGPLIPQSYTTLDSSNQQFKGTNQDYIFQEMSLQIENTRKYFKSTSIKLEQYFIGSKGENMNFLRELIYMSIQSHLRARLSYQKNDERLRSFNQKKEENSYINTKKTQQQIFIKNNFELLLQKLENYCVPFFNSRYFGHMNWETTLVSLAANFAALLYNQNNFSFEGGPITSIMQIQVVNQLAKMVNYPPTIYQRGHKTNDQGFCWGHMTSGGTISNIEALWVARDRKYLILSIRKYIQQMQTGKIKEIMVELPTGIKKKLLDLTAWELLNVTDQQAFSIYERAYICLNEGNQIGDKRKQYQKGIEKFLVGKVGLIKTLLFLQQINQKVKSNMSLNHINPIVICSSSAHYSIQKAVSVIGLGDDSVHKVPVDLNCRISINHLQKKLQQCLDEQIPVLAVVGILGSTEEGAIDNIEQILRLKNEFVRKGLYFHFHIDGAYGAYFSPLVRDRQPSEWSYCSQYTIRQLQAISDADSITIDAHKTGYTPYSSSTLLFRDYRLKQYLSFHAPYLMVESGPHESVYGLQGSKPGGIVTSTYFSLQVLPLTKSGHGRLIEEAILSSKVFAANLYKIKEFQISYYYRGNLSNSIERFDCYVLPRLYSQKAQQLGLEQVQEVQKQMIKILQENSSEEIYKKIKSNKNCDLLQNIMREFGSDTNILCYGINFIDEKTKKFNRSLKKFNKFNFELISLCQSFTTEKQSKHENVFVSRAGFKKQEYGDEFFNDFLKRYDLENDGQDNLILIRSAIMNPFYTNFEKEKHNIWIRKLLKNGCQALENLGER